MKAKVDTFHTCHSKSSHLGQLPDGFRLARAGGADERAAVESLEGLREGERGAFRQWGEDEAGGGPQVLVVVEEGAGQLLDVAGAVLVVRRHRRLGTRQCWGLLCKGKIHTKSYEFPPEDRVWLPLWWDKKKSHTCKNALLF